MSFGSEYPARLVVSYLRFKRIWIALGLLLMCAITALSLVDLAPVKGVMLQDKIMHMLAYGLLMGWFAQIYRRVKERMVLAIALVIMGVGIEYLQGMGFHRQFDIMDMLANTSGVLIAWVLSYTWLGRVFVGVEMLIARYNYQDRTKQASHSQ